MTRQIELGLDTFGDITAGPDGRLLSHAQVIRNVVEEAVLADKLGVDFFVLANTIGPILPFLHRRWCSRQLQVEPIESDWALL